MRSPVARFTSASSSRRKARGHLARGDRVPADAGERARATRSTSAALKVGTKAGCAASRLRSSARRPMRAAGRGTAGRATGGHAPSRSSEPRLLEQVDGRRHHARRLERIVPPGDPADVGQLDELRLAGRLVPAGDAGVRGAEVERPAGHAGPHSSAVSLVVPRSFVCRGRRRSPEHDGTPMSEGNPPAPARRLRIPRATARRRPRNDKELLSQ